MTERQTDLFGVENAPTVKPPRTARKLRVLITVKAAPNPSVTYGETVCVAGLSADPSHPGWIRLYPINFRDLDSSDQFAKYDIVELDAKPAEQDSRFESWRPNLNTLRKVDHLPPWARRRQLVDPQIEDSMCQLAPRADEPGARSLAAIRATDVSGLEIALHPGWSRDEQAKIDAYVNQADLFNEKDKTPLQAPRFIGRYRWRCADPACNSHTQQILDWEFVVLQRRLSGYSDDAAREALRQRFFDEICAKTKDLAFYVGNQAKRRRTFSIIGIYYPPKK